MKYILYIPLLVLLLSCQQGVESSAVGTSAIKSGETAATDQTKPLTQSPVETAKPNSCITAKDSVFIDQEIVIIEDEIERNDIAALTSRIVPASGILSNQEHEEWLAAILEFFSERYMQGEYQNELKTDKRLLPTDNSECYVYLVLQNFPQSEFAYSFLLTRISDKLVFQEIEIIG